VFNLILLYIAAFLLVFWGIAHLFPTRSVVRDFGDISKDNKRIITMEWIVEGVSLTFVGLIVAVASFLDFQSMVSRAIYVIVFMMLNTLSMVSLFTGFKVNFVPFKICPIIFTGSSILILLGSYL